MNKHSITIEFDANSLSNYEDSFLAALWHVAQWNPAPRGDHDAAQVAEQIGREIILRWLKKVPAVIWNRKGSDPYWETLVRHGRWVDGVWKHGDPIMPAAESAQEPSP